MDLHCNGIESICVSECVFTNIYGMDTCTGTTIWLAGWLAMSARFGYNDRCHSCIGRFYLSALMLSLKL